MGCKNFGLKDTHFWGFLAFVLTSFVKILEVGSTFISPPFPCVYQCKQDCMKKLFKFKQINIKIV